MTKADILKLSKTDRAEAIASARVFDFTELALELELAPDEPVRDKPLSHGKTLYQLLSDATLTVAGCARAARMSKATAQAAAKGRTAGGTTKAERERLAAFIRPRIAAMAAALEVCEGVQ